VAGSSFGESAEGQAPGGGMIQCPEVSVVIPTYERADLVVRAVSSALAQNVDGLEVIVVVDGRDEATCAELRMLDDERLRVHVPPRRLGNADARNEGVRLARGQWVAFLDDDDEWLAGKLEAQLRVVRASTHRSPIVACRFIARDEAGDFVWPRRLPATHEPLSEYFFCRKTPFTGEGIVQGGSAVLTSRELALCVPFRSGLQRHVDTDWLLRASVQGTLLFVPEMEPLLVWNIERGRLRITTQRDWNQSLAYCRDNPELFTRRGYAAFVLHVVSANAAAQGNWGAFYMLLREAFARGQPTVIDLVSHVGNFALPLRLQRAIAGLFARMIGTATGRSRRRTVTSDESRVASRGSPAKSP
jgi:glycosyltransferase involved in cell wall biosynthesis